MRDKCFVCCGDVDPWRSTLFCSVDCYMKGIFLYKIQHLDRFPGQGYVWPMINEFEKKYRR